VKRTSSATQTVDWDHPAEMSIMLKMEEIEELAADVSAEELHEFLAADGLDVPFDPLFKERLGEQLWSLVRKNASSR
jgi:hypothetical protein